MNQTNRKGFRHLDLDAKVTLIGQLLLTTGTAFLSLGQIFKLLKNDELPTVPVGGSQTTPQVERQTSLYGTRRNYFES